MTGRAASFLAATATIVVGLAAFVVFDFLRREKRVATFDREQEDVGPVEAINGIAFPVARGVVTVTEPLAHVRFPLGTTALGKTLVIQPRFHLDEGDVLEVGVKKTAFWLDYDRQPLAHRFLDRLSVRDEQPWSALHSGQTIIYLNPRFSNPWKTVEEFEKQPPTDGSIGLYGNAVLPCAADAGPCPTTAPFRMTDDPDSSRAIYAWYPQPDRSDPEWTVNAQRFDLSNVYRNEDGSLDVMFFVQRADGTGVRVLLDEVRYDIEPGLPDVRGLARFVRRNVVQLLRRPAASAS